MSSSAAERADNLRSLARSMVSRAVLQHLEARAQTVVPPRDQSRIARAVTTAIRDGKYVGSESDRMLDVVKWLSEYVQSTGNGNVCDVAILESLEQLTRDLAHGDSDAAAHHSVALVTARTALAMDPEPDVAAISGRYERVLRIPTEADEHVRNLLELAGAYLRFGHRDRARQTLDAVVVATGDMFTRDPVADRLAERFSAVVLGATAVLDLEAGWLPEAHGAAVQGLRHAQRAHDPRHAYDAALVAVITSDALGRANEAQQMYDQALRYRYAPRVERRRVELDGRTRDGAAATLDASIILPAHRGAPRFVAHPVEHVLEARFAAERELGLDR